MSTQSPFEKASIAPQTDPGTVEVIHSYGPDTIIEHIDQRQPGERWPAQLTYVSASGKTLDLNSLLPSHAKLVKQEGFSSLGYDASTRELLYDSERKSFETYQLEDFWTSGSMLAMLHEIGHAHYDGMLTTEEIPVIQSIHSPFPSDTFDASKLPIALDLLRRERRAWAYALRSLRDLRQEGIDLEPELPTMKDLLPLIHSGLYGYESKIMTRVVPSTMSQEDLRSWQLERAFHKRGHEEGVLSPRYLARYAIRPNKGLPTEVPPIPSTE